MAPTRGAAEAAVADTPVLLAKAALRRLALARIEPTPENFARAYAAEGGQQDLPLPDAARPVLQHLGAHFGAIGAPGEELALMLLQGRWSEAQALAERCTLAAAAQTDDWAGLVQRLALGLREGSRVWPAGRKNDSLQRVFDGSRGDPRRLRLRLDHLLQAWREGAPDPQADAAPADTAPGGDWLALVRELEATVRAALAGAEPAAAELARALQDLAGRVAGEGASAGLLREADALCARARRTLAQRQRLLDELGRLCVEMTEGLVELAENDSWARGQCEAMRRQLSGALDVRGVRAAAELLAHARRRQAELRGERSQARDALEAFIDGTLGEMGEFVEQTGRYRASIDRHAQAIERADSLASLSGVVREMLQDSREVQDRVGRTQQRLREEQSRAGAMRRRVRELEDELRRLSDEVSTDALTQVANRRGLAQAFAAERARSDAGGLALALIDIDNFKRLNDTLGHAAGDVALQRLAAEVRDKLRPGDTVARFGGEEFVVLLPGVDAAEAQLAVTRLQRQLTARLFMHDSREVFVTFSAGVTAVRDGEALEAAVERADEALYEAKRTGKNRTCVA